MKFIVAIVMALGCGGSAVAQTMDMEHSTVKEHSNFCSNQRNSCVEKNKWYRQHELVHCKIRYNQCIQEWRQPATSPAGVNGKASSAQ